MFQESCAKLERLKAVRSFSEESLKYDQKFFGPIISSLSQKNAQLPQFCKYLLYYCFCDV